VLRGADYYTAAIAKLVHMAPAAKFPWHATGPQDLGKNPERFRARLAEMLAAATR